jgi:hypothetical protein
MHGGKNERAKPGDPIRGGKPPTTYLDVELVPEKWRAVYRSALAQIGRLELELALLKTNLARFEFSEQQEPKYSEAERSAIVGEHVERIARVEERRARILTLLQNLDSPPDPVRLVLEQDTSEDVTDDARQRLRDKLLRHGK